MRPTRRASKAYVRDLALPPAASIRDLIPEIERRSGRSVCLLPAELEGSAPCGMYVATEGTNYVFYDPRTSPAHQDHIIAHEFAHILLNHQGGTTLPNAGASGLITLIDPAVVQMVLGRTDYDEEDEAAAEFVGSYLQAHVRSVGPVRPQTPEGSDVDRVAYTLLRPQR
ncbi:ImmA/IrrE family metallo-endopeptidase [Streptomyces sp. HK10]|uniref:ImmA/IrrE family metallo-endopeptidase n=1 Tax=Streptomyces sp. HK10 TaxID=3373255 RepID=UPI00374937A1